MSLTNTSASSQSLTLLSHYSCEMVTILVHKDGDDARSPAAVEFTVHKHALEKYPRFTALIASSPSPNQLNLTHCHPPHFAAIADWIYARRLPVFTIDARKPTGFDDLVETYKAAYAWGMEDLCNALLDFFQPASLRFLFSTWRLEYVCDGVGEDPAKMHGLARFVLAHFAWDLREFGWEWHLEDVEDEVPIAKRLGVGPASALVRLLALKNPVNPWDRADLCRWHVHDRTARCDAVKARAGVEGSAAASAGGSDSIEVKAEEGKVAMGPKVKRVKMG